MTDSVGRVVAVNIRDGEVGVVFTASGTERPTWLGGHEVVPADTPAKAPTITLRAERDGGRDAQRPSEQRKDLEPVNDAGHRRNGMWVFAPMLQGGGL